MRPTARSRTWPANWSRAKRVADERFEGIALTGRRVVFLVDMSGSMDLVDDKTPAAAEVAGRPRHDREGDGQPAAAREVPGHPVLGQGVVPARPATASGSTSRRPGPSKVNAALTATRPAGNTNMYAALDAAFQYRAQGLDTMYLLSDGLPNVGEGLTVDMARTMTESQRTEC